MSENWSWGVQKFSEDEQRQYNEYRNQVLGRAQGSGGEGENPYFDGQMPVVEGSPAPAEAPVAQPVEQEPVNPSPQYSTLWLAQPNNWQQISDAYQADPNYEDEHWSREQVDAVGSELAYRNAGRNRENWEPLMADDPFVTGVMQNSSNPWYDPAVEEQQAAAAAASSKSAIEEYYQPQNDAEAAFFTERESKGWENLKPWQQWFYALFPGQQESRLADAPEWTTKTQDAATALSSAGASAVVLKMAGAVASAAGAEGVGAVLSHPLTLAAGFAATFGLLYYQARTGKDMPVLNKVLEVTDLPDTITERVIGTMMQAGEIFGGHMYDADADPYDGYGFINALADTLDEVWQNKGDIWATSEYTYEMFGGLGDFAIDAANIIFEGKNYESVLDKWESGTGLGEAWMFNKGENEPVKLAEGTYGLEGMHTIREMISNMRDEGIEDEMIEAFIREGVLNASGFSGVVSDYTGQMVFDLSMFAPGLENNIAESISKATGFDVGVEAAQINRASSPISDMGVIGKIYNGITGAKESGGFNEWMAIAKDTILTKDVDTLTSREKAFAGLDAQGRIKQLLPNEGRQGLFEFLPETKVLGAQNIAMNLLNSQLSEASTEAEVRAVYENYANGTGGAVYNSPDAVTTRDAMKSAMPRTETYFQRYSDGAVGRGYLKQVAEALGMEQKEVLTLLESDPDTLTQRMTDYSAAHNGKIGTIEGGNIGTVVESLKAFTGENPLLWNLNELKALTSAALFEGMAEYNIKLYGVKPDGFITQMADTMKSAQSLFLLGLNPGYMINNVINNTVTAIAEGVFGLMTPKQMNAIFNEMGVAPARLGETMNEFRALGSGAGGLDAVNAMISDAKRTPGLLTDIRRAIRSFNGKAGVFSNISGKFEELQGKQVTATAINQYWKQTWKRGVGFQAMPEALVNAIESQTPGMTNMIYAAVERGMNMDGITKALYGEYIHADVSSTLRSIVQDMFPGDPTVFDEMFVKSGLLARIEAAYANATTEAERAAALQSIRDSMSETVMQMKRNEIINKAESIASIVDAEGPAAVQNIMGDLAISRAELWLLTRDEWNEAYEQIAQGASREILSEVNNRQRTAWQQQYAFEQQVLKGMMDGLGFETDVNARFLDTAVQINNSWQEFYQRKDQMVRNVYAEISRREAAMDSTELKMGAARVMRSEVWGRFYDETKAMYQEYFQREMDLQRQMDEIFVEGFQKATGKDGRLLAENLGKIRDIRQRMANMQNDAHDRTRNMTMKERAKFYAEFNPKYNQLIIEIDQIQKANGTIIDAEEGRGYEDHDPVNMTPETTVRAQQTVDTANTERERVIRARDGYMNRQEIRDAFVEAGRTPFEADSMMAVYDAMAEQWAAENGRAANEFYTEALRLKEIRTDDSDNARQISQGAKGMIEDSDGGAILRMFRASDVSTMVHESGHLFRRTLNERNLGDFTKWVGFDSVDEFQTLESRYWANDPTLTAAERARYEAAEEKFARGFEQYMIDGSAPTVGLKAVFKTFQNFLLSIYRSIRGLAVKDYSGEADFTFEGQPLNIHAEINGVKLADIFDRMLAGDQLARETGFTAAVQSMVDDMKMDRRNLRLSPEALQRRARREVCHNVLLNWGSLAEAEDYLAAMKAPIEIGGIRVDDAMLHEVIQYARSDRGANPFADTERHRLVGTPTYGYSNIDPNNRYQMHHEIVELKDLLPSNQWSANDLIVNPEYPAELQPRERGSMASRDQVIGIASQLVPGKIVDDGRAIDSGTPILGPDGRTVEAGNGRTMALLRVQEMYPEQWQAYQAYLRETAAQYGFDPAELDRFENPVLVRVRDTGDAGSFVTDANTRQTLDYSASEIAVNDANLIDMDLMSNLVANGGTEDVFFNQRNEGIVSAFLEKLAPNDVARYTTEDKNGNLALNMDGKRRFTNAVFAAVYGTAENNRVLKSFTETSDANILALEKGMRDTLPSMAMAEGLIRTGHRNADLSIANDVLGAAQLLSDARKARMNIHEFLAQSALPGMEWAPMQGMLAEFYGDAKGNAKMIRRFFQAYADAVERQPDNFQVSFLSDQPLGRDEIVAQAIEYARNPQAAADAAANPEGQKGPGLFQEVAAQTVQKAFDDGFAVQFDQIDRVNLSGASDEKYGKLLRTKSETVAKQLGYTDAQAEYAERYLDWKLSEERGDEPHAASPFIEDRVRADIDKVLSEDSSDIKELRRLRTRGAEVEPDLSIPKKGTWAKQVYAFQWGDQMIAANVYHDGEFVAWLPEDVSRMQRTISVDGEIYTVLGIDPNDPNGLVYFDDRLEQVKTVVPGQVEGVKTPTEPNSFLHRAKQGTTPDTMPSATSYQEIMQKYLDPVLNRFGDAFEMAETDARTANFKGLDLATRAQIEKWLDVNVKPEMAENKYRALKYSDMKKDAAMLNYNERYGFDPILTILSPYQFWYTRSMWQWAKRLIDKPRWGAMYRRMRDLEEKNRTDIMPSRLKGKIRIPMPFLPDWMGDGYYVDIMSQLFPFSQFGQSYGSDMTAAVLNARTEALLNDMYDAELITYEEMQEALETKKGTVWENAYQQAQREAGSEQMGKTLFEQFYSPNIFISWWNKKRAGEDPGQLGSTRTGNAIKALTSDVPVLDQIGGWVGDAMTLPEQGLRKVYGLEYNEFGAYGDQAIRKQISQMCADGEITWRQALNAMNEKSGTIWDMAAERQRQENALKVPGFAGASAIKSFVKGEAKFGDVIGALGASLLGGALFPKGERTLREMKAARDQAYIAKANGDADAVNRWYDENPEYMTRSATYMSDPEELLRYTLYNSITDIYYSQPQAQQLAIKKQLGPDFEAALLNAETRNWKAVPVQTLAEWNARIGGTSPNVGSIDVAGVERVMQYSDPVIESVDTYYAQRDQLYPGISTIQDGYYALPKDQRKNYLQYFPQLNSYWEWNRQYQDEHPEFEFWKDERSRYYDQRTCYNSYAEMTQYTQQELEYSRATGKPVSAAAAYELEGLHRKYGSSMSYDDYIKLLSEWK